MRSNSMPTTTASLMRKYRPLWTLTCRNPFLVGIRDGSLPTDVFDRWLVQDRHYVAEGFGALARVAAKAPREDRAAFVAALSHFDGVRRSFDSLLAKRRLDPWQPVHPVCRAYLDFLKALDFEPYVVGVVAVWAQYRAYRDAFAWARPGATPFRKIIRDWGSAAFALFEGKLRTAADAALAAASPRDVARAEETFVQVVRYELEFWVMTMDAR